MVIFDNANTKKFNMFCAAGSLHQVNENEQEVYLQVSSSLVLTVHYGSNCIASSWNKIPFQARG